MPIARPAASGTLGAGGHRPLGWRTAVDVALLAVVECLWTFPLVARLSQAIPGAPGDNLSFLWNFWWTRRALAVPGLHVFDTAYLFHPLHVDLALNTHTALNAWIGATLLAPWSIVTALNVTILASLMLAAWGAYGLALRRSRPPRGCPGRRRSVRDVSLSGGASRRPLQPDVGLGAALVRAGLRAGRPPPVVAGDRRGRRLPRRGRLYRLLLRRVPARADRRLAARPLAGGRRRSGAARPQPMDRTDSRSS